MLNATLSSPVNLGFPLFVVNFGLTIIQWSHALPFPPSCTSITNSFIPYAKDLTTGNKVNVNSSKPIISVQQEKITLKRGEVFNAKDYVKGLLTQART